VGEVLELINRGNARRVSAETPGNGFSSRSHAVI
jgi:hypothetical protein